MGRQGPLPRPFADVHILAPDVLLDWELGICAGKRTFPYEWRSCILSVSMRSRTYVIGAAAHADARRLETGMQRHTAGDSASAAGSGPARKVAGAFKIAEGAMEGLDSSYTTSCCMICGGVFCPALLILVCVP